MTAAVILAGFLSVLIYVNSYQPLGAGNFGHLPAGALKTVTDGMTDSFIITGQTGSTGSFGFSIADRGSYSVTILGVAGFNSYPYSLKWVPIHVGHQEFVDGTVARSLAFPAHIGAGGQIEIYVFVRRPACRRGEGWSFGQIPLQWEALGVHHTYAVSLSAPAPPDGALPVQLCYPATALRDVIGP